MKTSSSPCRRSNSKLADIIDVAVIYQEKLGYPSAKTFLMEHGVSKEIIKRVLAVPGKRRSSTVPHATA